MAIATNLLEKFGTDSIIGLIVSTIMGCTETTLYVISIYTSNLKIKKTRFVLLCALLADFAGILAAVVFWRILS